MLLAARVAFSVAIILIPFRLRLWTLHRTIPHLYPWYTDLTVFASDAVVLLTLVLWSLALSIAPRRPSLGPRHLWIPLAGMVAIGAASAMGSADPAISIYQALRLLLFFWFCVFVLNEIQALEWLVAPITIQLCIQSVVGLIQFLAQRSAGLQSLGEALLDPSQAGVGVVVAGGVRFLRAYGLSDHPNILGGSLAFGLVFLLGAYLQGRARWSILVAFTLGVPALLVTFSRAASLAFVAGAILLLGIEIGRRRWQLLKPLAMLALATLIPVSAIVATHSGFFGARLDANNSFGTPTMEQQSIGERAILINASLPLVRLHPLLGVGLGASPAALANEAPGLTIPYQPPHLVLLDAAIETGFPGAAIYLFLLLAPFALALRHVRQFLAEPARVTSLAVLLSIAIVGLFDYYTWLLPSGLLWQWLAWGIWGLANLQESAIPITTQTLVVDKAGAPA